jgi:hypothetical protein
LRFLNVAFRNLGAVRIRADVGLAGIEVRRLGRTANVWLVGIPLGGLVVRATRVRSAARTSPSALR